MNITIFATLVVLVAAGPLCAQGADDKEAVKGVITRLFTGMQKGDSAMVHAAFAGEVTMATAFRDKTGKPMLHRENSIADFLKAVGTPHKETWYEEIWNLDIRIDGDFAQAWCDYAFYVGNTFSHCGIDAFHLHKKDGAWKIFHLSDTRRKDDCIVPEDVSKKHQ